MSAPLTLLESNALSEKDAIAFIDLEASGLGPRSWPIEVGWCFPEGIASAFLIQPHEDWPLDEWDKRAEALHGIAYDDLAKKGANIKDICGKLNNALAGKIVYSDAPDWDGFWLFRLFQAAKMRQRFTLFDFGDLLRRIAGDTLWTISERANEVHPHNHRAGDDVRHMLAVYQLALAAEKNH